MAYSVADTSSALLRYLLQEVRSEVPASTYVFMYVVSIAAPNVT